MTTKFAWDEPQRGAHKRGELVYAMDRGQTPADGTTLRSFRARPQDYADWTAGSLLASRFVTVLACSLRRRAKSNAQTDRGQKNDDATQPTLHRRSERADRICNQPRDERDHESVLPRSVFVLALRKFAEDERCGQEGRESATMGNPVRHGLMQKIWGVM
jgi:hypothetical protein